MSIKVEINDYGNSYVIERNGFCATIKRVEAESLCRDLADALGWDKLDELRAERDSALAAANHNLSCTAKAVAELEEAKGLLRERPKFFVNGFHEECVSHGYAKWDAKAMALLAGAGAKPSEVCPKHPDRRVLPGERCFDCVTDERAGDTKQCEHCRGEGYSECQCLPADESAGVDTEPYAFLAGHDYPITALPVGSRFTCGPVTTTILGVCADGCVKVDHDGEDGHFNKDALVRFIGTAPPVAKQAEGRPSDAERQQVVDTLVANFSSLAEPVRKLLAYTKRLEKKLELADWTLTPTGAAHLKALEERAEAAEAYGDMCDGRLEVLEAQLSERDSGGERRTRWVVEREISPGCWDEDYPEDTQDALLAEVANYARYYPALKPRRAVKVTELREVLPGQPLSAAAVDGGDMSAEDCDICGNTIPFCDDYIHEVYTRAWDAGLAHGTTVGRGDERARVIAILKETMRAGMRTKFLLQVMRHLIEKVTGDVTPAPEGGERK